MKKQHPIPYPELPKGISLSLKNSDRLRKDAEILANAHRYNSALNGMTRPSY